MSIETSIGRQTEQPYAYRRVELVEPDWTRVPGWKDVTAQDWASVQWQRAHCVKNLKQLRDLMGDLVDESFYADLEKDQAERATMSMLVPPQMMNTIAPQVDPTGPNRGDKDVHRDGNGLLHKTRGGRHYDHIRPNIHGAATENGTLWEAGAMIFRVVVETRRPGR